MVLNHFAAPRYLWHSLETFFIVTTGDGVLLATITGSEMLKSLQCTGQLPTTENYLVQNSVNRAEVEKPCIKVIWTEKPRFWDMLHSLLILCSLRKWSRSVLSDSFQPYGLPSPLGSSGKNTGGGCHFLLQSFEKLLGFSDGSGKVAGHTYRVGQKVGSDFFVTSYRWHECWCIILKSIRRNRDIIIHHQRQWLTVSSYPVLCCYPFSGP